MKKWTLLLLIAVGAPSLWARGVIGPDLQKLLATTGSNELIPVSIVLQQQIDNNLLEARCKGLRKAQRWELAVGEMKNLSARTQQPLLNRLQSGVATGAVSGVKDIIPFWIVNAVYCRATPGEIENIVGLNGIRYVESDNIVTSNALLVTPETYKQMQVKGNVHVGIDALPAYNVQQVGADSVWHILHYRGDSVTVGHIDTGCNYNHDDLASHMWNDTNYPNHGWNFELGTNDPMDVSGHGTHTAGTVASDGTAGETCGMAPRARIMACRTKTSIGTPYPDTIAENTVLNAMQFCIAPPLSPTHHADCITMSLGWYLSWTPRQAVWRQAVTNVSTAGLPFLIAAGNERGAATPPYACRCPGNVPGPWHNPAEAAGGRGGAITIAAVDSSDVIAYFSSPGPVAWDTIHPYLDYAYPPGLLKPDVAAPGVNITSCDYSNIHGYIGNYSGTSMATPCVAGVTALMLQKNPELLPWQADSILQMCVLPLGSQPKNNDYGTGRISAYRAVMLTPNAGDQHDVAAQAILAPADTFDTIAGVLPRAVVRNLGNKQESFPVIFKIGHSYCDTELVGLAVGESAVVNFVLGTGIPRGTSTMSCSTALATDTYPANNKVTCHFQVIVYDIAAESIVKPFPGQRLVPNIQLYPEIKVKNAGTEPLDTVRARFLISDRANFSDTLWRGDTTFRNLNAGASRDLRFMRTFSPLDSGTFHTRLEAWVHHGRNPFNDTLQGEFYVIVGIAEQPPTGVPMKPKVLPTVVRAPFKLGPEFDGFVVYDALGRSTSGDLLPGVYYLMRRTSLDHRKLVVLN